MNRIVFDIEANGLNELIINGKGQVTPEATEVHCLVTLNLDTSVMKSYGPCEIEQGVEELRNADLLIGHNIMMYDVPLLRRLYGPINTKCLDTLIISKLMYPDKGQHPLGGNSLDCWGQHLDYAKTDYQGGWEAFSEEMLKYCEQDVRLNARVYEAQKEFIDSYDKVVRLEHMVTGILAKQIENGFGFDLRKGEELLDKLSARKSKIEEYFGELFPPKVEIRYSEKTGKRLKDKVTVFNPGSRKQIAERLQEKYSWVPPVTEKGNPKVDETVLKTLPYREAEVLVKYFNDIKLMGQVSDWIKRSEYSRDGRIHGGINPQGTVTGRMTASQPNLQQVSGDKRARSLFVPRSGWNQVGIDAKGLEARMLANRMYPYDGGSYGKIVTDGDIHSENQQLAGLPERDMAKTFFYGFLYGAGDAKIGKIVGQSSNAGKELKERFLRRLPALKKVIQKCKFQVNKSGTIELLDGRKVPCRSVHAALNVQLQGDGAVIMKLAQCILSTKIKKHGFENQAKFMATVHDEWQLEVHPDITDKVGELGCLSIQEAGERLGCKVKLEGDFKVGRNWAECH
tara:strand:+ start:390 stop:2093 length:1704 start_codon:yes stop_codon:yes gene_type:complete